VRRYKPASQVYHMAAKELYASTAEICMVSTHVWDTLGGAERWLSSSAYRQTRQCAAAQAGGAWLAAGADSCRVKSSERGCAADQTLALTAFGPDIEPLPIARRLHGIVREAAPLGSDGVRPRSLFLVTPSTGDLQPTRGIFPPLTRRTSTGLFT
jgi:hypothetical protein